MTHRKEHPLQPKSRRRAETSPHPRRTRSPPQAGIEPERDPATAWLARGLTEVRRYLQRSPAESAAETAAQSAAAAAAEACPVAAFLAGDEVERGDVTDLGKSR